MQYLLTASCNVSRWTGLQLCRYAGQREFQCSVQWRLFLGPVVVFKGFAILSWCKVFAVLNVIKSFGFVMGKLPVSCEVQTESLCIGNGPVAAPLGPAVGSM